MAHLGGKRAAGQVGVRSGLIVRINMCPEPVRIPRPIPQQVV